jgi:hypothetical protein
MVFVSLLYYWNFFVDQSFDIPDRTFHSTNTTWRLSSFESMTDVKELIPEFFYLPEFLVNREGKQQIISHIFGRVCNRVIIFQE